MPTTTPPEPGEDRRWCRAARRDLGPGDDVEPVTVPPQRLDRVTGVHGGTPDGPVDLATGLAHWQEADRLASLSPAQCAELIGGAARLVRWAESVLLAGVTALADYAGPEHDRDAPARLPGRPGLVESGFATAQAVEEFCADQLGVLLNVSHTRAQRIIGAGLFVRDVPAARSDMQRGHLGLPQVLIMADRFRPVAHDLEFVTAQLPELSGLGSQRLAQRITDAVIAHRPEAAEERRRQARQTRAVRLTAGDDGMASLAFRLPAEDAQLAFRSLTAAAHTLHDRIAEHTGDCTGTAADPTSALTCSDHRPRHVSLDNRRADAFMLMVQELFERLHDTDLAQPGPAGVPINGRRHGRPAKARTMLHVVMRASTLAGLDDRPCELLGHGAITADHARDIATGATIKRILTDPVTGDVRAVDTPRYRAPALLRWAMIIQHRTCVFPGCAASAVDADLDHIDPHPDGRRTGDTGSATGRTSLGNAQPLCRRHHRIKTHGGWHIETGDPRESSCTWYDPLGYAHPRQTHWRPPPEFREQYPERATWPALTEPGRLPPRDRPVGRPEVDSHGRERPPPF